MPWHPMIFTAHDRALPPSTTWMAAHVDVEAASIAWWQCHHRYSDGGCATIAAEELCLRHDATPNSLFTIYLLPSSEKGAELSTKTSSCSALSTTESWGGAPASSEPSEIASMS